MFEQAASEDKSTFLTSRAIRKHAWTNSDWEQRLHTFVGRRVATAGALPPRCLHDMKANLYSCILKALAWISACCGGVKKCKPHQRDSCLFLSLHAKSDEKLQLFLEACSSTCFPRRRNFWGALVSQGVTCGNLPGSKTISIFDLLVSNFFVLICRDIALLRFLWSVFIVVHTTSPFNSADWLIKSLKRPVKRVRVFSRRPMIFVQVWLMMNI